MSTLSRQERHLLLLCAYHGTRGAAQPLLPRVAMPIAALYVQIPIVRRRAPIDPAGTAMKSPNVVEVPQDPPPVLKLAVLNGFFSRRIVAATRSCVRSAVVWLFVLLRRVVALCVST